MFCQSKLFRVVEYLVVGSIFLLILTSCSNALGGTIGDGGIISSASCSAPCFLGVVPGITTKDQIRELFSQEKILSFCNIGDNIYCGNLIYIGINTQGYVDLISFSPTTPTDVQAIIKKYGKPDAIDVVDLTLTPESPYIQAGLFYDELNTYFQLVGDENFDYELKPDTLLSKALYFDQGKYHDFRKTSKHILNWQGYTIYRDPYHGP